MSETMTACACCGRMKAVDGFIYCGGSYCLHDAERHDRPDDPLDRALDEDWTAEGNANEPEAT